MHRTCHCKTKKCVYQLIAKALYIVMIDIFQESSTDVWKQHTFDEWQFKFWSIALRMELDYLLFLRSVWKGDFLLYIASIEKLLPWISDLDLILYARWLTVHHYNISSSQIQRYNLRNLNQRIRNFTFNCFIAIYLHSNKRRKHGWTFQLRDLEESTSFTDVRGNAIWEQGRAHQISQNTSNSNRSKSIRCSVRRKHLSQHGKPNKNQTFKDYSSKVFRLHVKKHRQDYYAERIDVVFDTYKHESLKAAVRCKSGESVRSRKLLIHSVSQFQYCSGWKPGF